MFLIFSIKFVYLSSVFLFLTSLVIVYVSEFWLKVEICSMCVYERFPYMIILYFLSVVLFKYFFRQSKVTLEIFRSFLNDIMFCNKLIITMLFFSILLSAYHWAFEKGFFNQSVLCSHSNLDISSVSKEFYTEFVLNGKNSPCNLISLKIFGFSFTELNLIFNICWIIIFIITHLKIYESCFFAENFYNMNFNENLKL